MDESNFGGKERNKHTDQKLRAGGTVGNSVVVSVIGHTSGRTRTKVLAHTNRDTLWAFIRDHVPIGANVCTNEARAY